MFQADEWIHKINALDHGHARLAAMETAIQEADREQEHYWRILFRYEYVKESIFHDDNFKAILMFPQLLQIFDEHPELEDEFCDDVMQAFKWILENIPDYYQVSLEEIDRYYEEYLQRCNRYGLSLRVYYMKKSKQLLPIDRQAAQEAYAKFHECKRDANSDCEACEINFDSTFALELGNVEEAMKIAKPLLEGTKRCAEVPHVTYGVLAKHYLYEGNFDEAQYYGKLCEQYTKLEAEFMTEIGTLMSLWSCVNVTTGWKILKSHIDHFVSCKNPAMRMAFATGAYHVLRKISEETDTVDSILLKALPVERGEDGYDITALCDYFYGVAEEQSRLLDQRNGTSYYMDQLKKPLPAYEGEMDPVAASQSSKHGYAPKTPSGLMVIPDGDTIPPMPEIEKRIQALSDAITIVNSSVENDVLYVTLRYHEDLHDFICSWMPITEELTGYPCYGMPREQALRVREAKMALIMHLDLSEHTFDSYHLLMKLAHCCLPDLIGAIDLNTSKLFPGYWVAFAGLFENAISPADLLRIHFCRKDDEDNEIWMTTIGMCCLGMKEIELIGANISNYEYYADLLHFTACMCVEQNTMPDAGAPLCTVRIGDQKMDLTWEQPDAQIREGSFAAEITRDAPSAALTVLPHVPNPETVAPAMYAPMLSGNEISYPNSQFNFLRGIYLAKETFGCFVNALEVPHHMAAVRLEFPLSNEMREECGYSMEMLWANQVHMENGKMLAVIDQTSELLPEYEKGDVVEVSPQNLTSWLIQMQPNEPPYTENEAFVFL